MAKSIAYFFARELQGKLNVPIGIVNSSWGGTPAEAWMPVEAVNNDEFLSKAAAIQQPVPWGPVETARIYNSIKVEDSGPLFKEIVIDKNMAVISFDHADGLHATEKEITCFEIAGEDHVFYPADATIKNQQVIVQSKKVKSPVNVRFAWRNTATPNLFNGANLPASCFNSKEE